MGAERGRKHVLAEEAGVEPTGDAFAPPNGFEDRADHRIRYSSQWLSLAKRENRAEFAKTVPAHFSLRLPFEDMDRLRARPLFIGLAAVMERHRRRAMTEHRLARTYVGAEIRELGRGLRAQAVKRDPLRDVLLGFVDARSRCRTLCVECRRSTAARKPLSRSLLRRVVPHRESGAAQVTAGNHTEWTSGVQLPTRGEHPQAVIGGAHWIWLDRGMR
jgi:hypothetical protein